MPGHLAPVPQTWKQGRVQSSPLNRSKGRIVMKQAAPRACAGRELQRRDLTARERCQALEKPAGGSPASSAVSFRTECLRPTTSLQRRLRGGVETDPEGFIPFPTLSIPPIETELVRGAANSAPVVVIVEGLWVPGTQGGSRPLPGGAAGIQTAILLTMPSGAAARSAERADLPCGAWPGFKGDTADRQRPPDRLDHRDLD
jgi:hypothetical protein